MELFFRNYYFKDMRFYNRGDYLFFLWPAVEPFPKYPPIIIKIKKEKSSHNKNKWLIKVNLTMILFEIT